MKLTYTENDLEKLAALAVMMDESLAELGI